MSVDYPLGFLAYSITILIGFVGSYFYLSIFAAKSGAPGIDENLQRQIVAQIQMIVAQMLNTFIAPFLALWLAAIQAGQVMAQNWKYVLAVFIFYILCILMHYEHQDLMSGLDQFWRCFAHTAFYNFFVPFLQIFRLIYGFITPLMNLLMVTWYQITKGSIQIFVKCQINTIFIPIEHMVMGVLKLALGFIDFLGFTKLPLSPTNNIAVNDFNIEPGIMELQMALNSTQNGLRCACNALDPVWDFGFAPVTSNHLPKAIDHWFNVLVRISQMFLRIIIPPGEAPNVARVVYHIYGGILEMGLFLDHILYTTVINVVRIFSVGLFDEGGIVLPEEFVGGAASRVALTILQVPVNLCQGIWSMFNPMTVGDSSAMMNAFSMDDVWANLYIALYDISNSIHWFLYLIENLIGGLMTASTIKGADLPATFNCNWADDYAPDNYPNWPHAPHMISYTLACTVHNFGLTVLGGMLVPSELIKELFFKSIVLQEQNMLRVIQKYDGMWSSRETITTCYTRQARATPLSGAHRLDWTIDPDQCRCDMRLGEYVAPDPNHLNEPLYRYASEPVYNPWCGQPTLQDQIFAPLEAMTIYLTHGIFGPTGIGEIFQYYSFPDLNTLMKGAPEELKPVEIEGVSIPPTTRTVIELMRVTVRLLLSFPDIVMGRWIYYDINCGYGLNTTHLEFRYAMMKNWQWNSTAEQYYLNGKPMLMPTDDATLRWGPCKDRRFKFPGLVYRREDDMKTCMDSNESPDCSCNYMLPLTIDSPCGCIATLPKISTVADDNPISNYIAYKKIAKASFRWCNSNYLEWFFFMQNQLLDSLAYLISFGPWNTDCTANRAITPETDFGAYYVMATVATTDASTGDDAARGEKFCAAGGDKIFAELLAEYPNLEQIMGAKCEQADFDLFERPMDDMNLADDENPGASIQEDFSTMGDGYTTWGKPGGFAMNKARGSCKLWSNDNLFCSMAMILRTAGGAIISLQRQIHNNVVMFMAGNWNDFDLDLRTLICDSEKFSAQIIGAAANVITFGGARGFKKALGKVGVGILEMGLAFVKTGNILIQFVLGIVSEVKKAATGQSSGGDLGSGLQNQIQGAIKDIIRSFLEILILWCDALGDFISILIGDSSPNFFYAMGDMLQIIVDALLGVIFNILGMIFDMLFKLIAFFSGTGSLGDFLTAFLGGLLKILLVLVKDMGKILVMFFMMMGTGLSNFLSALASGFCNAINAVICTLTLSMKCSIMSCVSGGFGNAEGQPLGSAFQGYRSKYGQGGYLPRLFATHYHAVDGIPAPKWVAENIDWNGTSTCDLFMEGVRFYNYTELRPLERATWLECLESRALGQELDNLIGIPELKLYDTLYNWRRKYVVGLQATQISMILLNIAVQDGAITEAKLRKQLIEINMDPAGPLALYNNVMKLLSRAWEEFNLGGIMDEVMMSFDPEYAVAGRVGSTARMYTIGKQLHEVGGMTKDIWKKKDMSRRWNELWTMKERATTEDGWLKSTFTDDKHLQSSHHMLMGFMDKAGHHIRRSKRPGQQKVKFERSRFGNPYRLSKPLNTNITWPDHGGLAWPGGPNTSVLCPNPESPACVNCIILDNFFEIVRDWAAAYGRFVSNVYGAKLQDPDPVTGFVQPGTLVDINDYFYHMMTNNSGFVDNTQQLTRAKHKLHRKFHPYREKKFKRHKHHKLRSQAAYDSTIAPITARWPRVGRDWSDWYGNYSAYYFGSNNAGTNTTKNDTAYQTKRLVQGLKRLLSSATDEYVPFFGYGIPYTVSFIFTESCQVETAVWNEGTSQSERLSNIDNALWACLIFTVALMTNGMWSVIPLGFVVNTIVLLQLNKLLFFWIVYGYLPSCEPTMPQMLMEDIVEWIQHRIAPGCFCSDWPVLAGEWCAPSTCYQCDIAAGQYINCNDELPFAAEWGVWWWFPMALRVHWPESISWLATTGIVAEGDAAFQNLVFEAFQYPDATTSLQRECVSVTFGDAFVNLVLLSIAGYIVFQVIMVVVKFLIDFSLMLMQIFFLFQWTAVAIEQTTRVYEDETDESAEIFSG